MEYFPMTIEQFIMEESPDEQYYFYRPAVPLQIFHSMVEPDEDSENCCIEVSVRYDLQQMLPVINRYLEWLASCEEEVTSYFQERLGEEVPENQKAVLKYSPKSVYPQQYSCTLSLEARQQLGMQKAVPVAFYPVCAAVDK